MKNEVRRFLNRVGYAIFFAIYISIARRFPILLEVYFNIPALVILVFLVRWAVDTEVQSAIAKYEEDVDEEW